MAELTTSEKLQPSLLDRLTDDDRTSRVESREKRVMSMKNLRAAVLRDLSWLLNTSAHPMGAEIYEFPLASQSVLNYGLPDATGMSSSGLSIGQVEGAMRRAITTFEPRIMQGSLRVRASVDENRQKNPAVIGFEIAAEFCPLPMPETLYVRSEVDLETGQFELRGV